MDVVFLFGEGAPALGFVDDGLRILAPVEKVVRRAVEQQAEAFEVVGLDVAELIIEPRIHRLRHKTILYEPTIRFADPASL